MGSKLGSACNQVDLVDYRGGTSLGLGQRPGPDFWLVEDKPQARQASVLKELESGSSPEFKIVLLEAGSRAILTGSGSSRLDSQRVELFWGLEKVGSFHL